MHWGLVRVVTGRYAQVPRPWEVPRAVFAVGDPDRNGSQPSQVGTVREAPQDRQPAVLLHRNQFSAGRPGGLVSLVLRSHSFCWMFGS